MKIDLDKIEQTAKAATLWSTEGDAESDEMDWKDVLDCDVHSDCMPTTLRYLEACSPDAVLAMVARIRELEDLVFRYEWKMRNLRESGRDK